MIKLATTSIAQTYVKFIKKYIQYCRLFGHNPKHQLIMTFVAGGGVWKIITMYDEGGVVVSQIMTMYDEGDQQIGNFYKKNHIMYDQNQIIQP